MHPLLSLVGVPCWQGEGAVEGIHIFYETSLFPRLRHVLHRYGD